MPHIIVHRFPKFPLPICRLTCVTGVMTFEVSSRLPQCFPDMYSGQKRQIVFSRIVFRQLASNPTQLAVRQPTDECCATWRTAMNCSLSVVDLDRYMVNVGSKSCPTVKALPKPLVCTYPIHRQFITTFSVNWQ